MHALHGCINGHSLGDVQKNFKYDDGIYFINIQLFWTTQTWMDDVDNVSYHSIGKKNINVSN